MRKNVTTKYESQSGHPFIIPRQPTIRLSCARPAMYAGDIVVSKKDLTHDLTGLMDWPVRGSISN